MCTLTTPLKPAEIIVSIAGCMSVVQATQGTKTSHQNKQCAPSSVALSRPRRRVLVEFTCVTKSSRRRALKLARITRHTLAGTIEGFERPDVACRTSRAIYPRVPAVADAVQDRIAPDSRVCVVGAAQTRRAPRRLRVRPCFARHARPRSVDGLVRSTGTRSARRPIHALVSDVADALCDLVAAGERDSICRAHCTLCARTCIQIRPGRTRNALR
eukprot:2496071-Rhodomonas_salina.1